MMNIQYNIDEKYRLSSPQVFDFLDITPIEIEFGIPKANKCQNFGICRMVRLVDWNNNINSIRPCRKARAYFIWRSATTIQLSVLRTSMLPCTQKKYFGQGRFLMTQDFCLPKLLCPLATTTIYFIPKGNYRAMKNSEFVHLILPLQIGSSLPLKREDEKWRYPNAADP